MLRYLVRLIHLHDVLETVVSREYAKACGVVEHDVCARTGNPTTHSVALDAGAIAREKAVYSLSTRLARNMSRDVCASCLVISLCVANGGAAPKESVPGMSKPDGQNVNAEYGDANGQSVTRQCVEGERDAHDGKYV